MFGEHDRHDKHSGFGCCGPRVPRPAHGRPSTVGLVRCAPGWAGSGLEGLTWPDLREAGAEAPAVPARRRLLVKPILTYPQPVPHPQTSWRNWGGIQSADDLAHEVQRIHGELERLKTSADFPLELLPLAQVRGAAQLAALRDAYTADALLVYAAGDGAGDLMAEVNLLEQWGKDTILFVRHQSGPLYYWYEGVSARFHRQHTDQQTTRTIRCEDTVVDRMEEVLWRLRALAGLRATVGTRILAIGWPDPAVWPPEPSVQPLLRPWQFAVESVSYHQLGQLIRAARQDPRATELARTRAEQYLAQPHTQLQTEFQFVQNAFLLEQIFRGLLVKSGCRAITVAACMSVIIPMAETTACLPLSLLNDAGYLAWCEADFFAIPAATLLANIVGRPVFLCAPGFPHEKIITLAHCSAPRIMDGPTLWPAAIMTHYESDYGAAPRVEMPIGHQVTLIVPDYAGKRWLGLSGQIAANPRAAVCRTQVDVRFQAPDSLVAERMPGYRWVLASGRYLREVGYALRRVGVTWDCLG